MLFEFSLLCIFLALGFAFVLGALVAGIFVRPNPKRAYRLKTYECGEIPVGQGWYNFNPRFYMMALVFLIFDVEVVVTYPVVTVLRKMAENGQGFAAFLEILLFVVILVTGLAFLWVRGDLEWIKKIEKN